MSEAIAAVVGGLEVVKVSVQGHLFILPRETVLQHDWMVATLTTTSVPADKVGDALYIDCDGPSFRSLYGLLTGTLDLSILSSFSQVERYLLFSTAQFLAPSHSLTVQIKQMTIASVSMEEKLKAAQTKMTRLEEQLSTMMTSSEAMSTNHQYVEKIESMEDVSFAVYQCNAHRKYRPGNICGNTILQICSERLGTVDAPTCDHCKALMSQLKMGRHQTSFQDFLSTYCKETSSSR